MDRVGRGRPSMNTLCLTISEFSLSSAEARVIMSKQHKSLGFRPPASSLAARAQLAAAKHPCIDPSDAVAFKELEQAAMLDTERIL